jgi:parallel beta-helix repeat protein/predicted outer membrane repeat protein
MRRIMVLTAFCLTLSSPAFAAHCHLRANGTGDYATIQAAVTAMSSGDTILCADGAYTGSGNSDIDFGGKNLILKSESNHPKDCIIEPFSGRGFNFHSGETSSAIVQGFTIEDGSESNGGGFFIQNSSPTIFNCIIKGCYASGNGGGIYVTGASANPSILNCLIIQNQALNDGGGIRFYYSLGIAKNCTIVYNTGDYAGGISFQGGDADVINCIIWGNMPYQLEGAIFGLFSYNLVQGWTGGGTSFAGDPDFVTSTNGSYYLNQATSDAINKGDALASSTCFTTADGLQCMDRWTTGTNQQDDAGQVDVGYHYPHYSAVINVPSYKTTIQAAIDAAWNGDIVQIADGTYTGDGNRDLDTKAKRVTVRSQSGNANNCVIDCQGSAGSPHRGFYIRRGEGSSTVLRNLKIMNAWVSSYGGGINISSCSPTIEGCILSANHAGIDGGGIMNSQGNPAITGCTFISNTAGDAGGGMLNHTCSPVLTNCTFQSNWALWGGGGMYNYESSPTLNSCTFRYNESEHWGGGLHNAGTHATPYLYDCVFQENQAIDGAGMYCRQGAEVTLEDCDFIVNNTYTAGKGGGIYSSESDLYLTRCLFDGNEAAVDGGGIYGTTSNSASVDSCLFVRNTTSSGGGAIYFYNGGSSVLSNCTFVENESPNGGALWTWTGCFTNVVRCIFWENRATTAGNQIGINGACTMPVTCCDVQGGQAGVFVGGGSTLTWGGNNFDEDPRFCHAERGDYAIHSTSPCAPAHSVCGLVGAKQVGCTQTAVDGLTPSASRLHQSYPNPFNPATRIAFDVKETALVSLKIFDVSGRLVRTLAESRYAPGSYAILWNGQDESGRAVASGTYFCRMTAGTYSDTKKIVLLK